MQPPVRSCGKFRSPAQNVWNSIPRQCFPPLKVSERQERDCSCLCSPGLTPRKSGARRRRMNCGEGCGSEMQIQTTLLWITTMQIQLAFVILTASVVVAGQDGAWCSPNVPGTSQQSVEYEIAGMSLVLTDPRSPNVHLKEFHSISAQVSSYSDYFWVD